MSLAPERLDGVHVALVTPFTADGEVDHAALRRLAEQYVDAGVQGIVPCGSTGESATLSHAEHVEVIRTVVEAVRGRVPVIAGTGSNSTREAVALTAAAREAGADAALVIAPYYNKPTQEGLYRHFAAIAEEGGLPLVLYNIPGRTAVSIAPETVARLAELEAVVGIKDATGDLAYTVEVLRRVPPEFRLLAGDDGMFLPMLALGGHGVISVVAHLAPAEIVELWRAWRDGDHARARSLHERLWPLVEALFVETNPAPVKEALYILGRLERPDLRLPLVRISDASKARLREALAAFGFDLVRGWS